MTDIQIAIAFGKYCLTRMLNQGVEAECEGLDDEEEFNAIANDFDHGTMFKEQTLDFYIEGYCKTLEPAYVGELGNDTLYGFRFVVSDDRQPKEYYNPLGMTEADFPEAFKALFTRYAKD